MVIFLREHDSRENADVDEFIYINRDEKKEEDDDMQMLTPILLDSMFDSSPADVHQVIKRAKDMMDHPDDTTEETSESFPDIVLPSVDTSSRVTHFGNYDDDETSEISLDSYDRRVHLSPRGIISRGTVSNNYNLSIPADVRFEGDVLFTTSSSAQHINLKPRQSAHSDMIFNVKQTYAEAAFYGAYSLADSISSYTYDQGYYDDEQGAEECKDDFEAHNTFSYEEGFAYVIGSRRKEDEYWGYYNGHYGSRDFEDHKEYADYALDHESVRGVSRDPSVLSSTYLKFGAPLEESRSFLDELQEFFAAFFSCNVFSAHPQVSPKSTLRFGGSFGPADFGVAPRDK